MIEPWKSLKLIKIIASKNSWKRIEKCISKKQKEFSIQRVEWIYSEVALMSVFIAIQELDSIILIIDIEVKENRIGVSE